MNNVMQIGFKSSKGPFGRGVIFENGRKVFTFEIEKLFGKFFENEKLFGKVFL